MKGVERSMDYWIIRIGTKSHWLLRHSKILTLIFLIICKDYWPEFLDELNEYRAHRKETWPIRCGASSIKSRQARK